MNFPDTIDRHLAREWLKSFGLTTGAILGLFYIQNLYDKLGDFLSHGVGVTQILHYYLLLTPSLLSPVLPLSVLVAPPARSKAHPPEKSKDMASKQNRNSRPALRNGEAFPSSIRVRVFSIGAHRPN